MRALADSTEPDAIREEDVVERSVDGPEEGTHVATAVLVRQSRELLVEATIEPSIVLREATELPEMSVHAQSLALANY